MDADIEQVAVTLGETLVQQILDGKPLEDIKASLDIGAPVWYQTLTEGLSALHAAAYMQNHSLAKLLIERGAIWNAGTLFGYMLANMCFRTHVSGLPEAYRRGHRPII